MVRDLFHEMDVSTLPDLVAFAVSLIRNASQADDSGCLEEDEVATLSAEMGHRFSASELRRAMEIMDNDGSGEIDFKEFYEFCKPTLR